jgi:alpha-L-fucosidase
LRNKNPTKNRGELGCSIRISSSYSISINVGPSHDGVIMPIFQERLSQMGDWLRVNGEAIYSSVPWKFQNDTVTPKVW